MTRNIELRTIESNVNYWVVRAGEQGAYFPHFRQGNVISIGHLDGMLSASNEQLNTQLNAELNDETQFDNLMIQYRNSLESAGIIKGSVTLRLSQVTKFVHDIKCGDVVISIGKDNIAAGVVTSDAYYSDTPIIVRNADDSPMGDNLEYVLRRNIQWTKKQSKKSIPYALQKSLKANQAVFSINEHWRAINHWLNVFFIKDESIYFSSRIEQTENINNFDVAQYSILLNKIEAFTKNLSKKIEDNVDLSSIDEDWIRHEISESYAQMLRERDFTLTTQQSFMSPGDFFGELKCPRIQRIIYTAVFASIMNVTVAYAEEDLNIVANHQQIIDSSAAIIKDEAQFDQIKDSLKLRVPKSSDTVVPRAVDTEDTETDEGTLTHPEEDDDFPDDEPASFSAQ
uniref:Uncharacterized protein n=1 Tax=Aliivibrio wodanis TaxID=80852 RepID=A0A5Q4ZVR3_9GAMM|nr:hypothetical protein AW0309160_01864 [Aliivibrio wodanis]